jgi:hypothetical protein
MSLSNSSRTTKTEFDLKKPTFDIFVTIDDDIPISVKSPPPQKKKEKEKKRKDTLRKNLCQFLSAS